MSNDLSALCYFAAAAVLMGGLVVRAVMAGRRPAPVEPEPLSQDQRFDCPHCTQHIAAGREFLGTMVTCPNCAGAFTLPPPQDWPGGADGLRWVAVGTWAEVFMRVYPLVQRSMGLSVSVGKKDLVTETAASLAWPEMAAVLGAVVSILGLGMCLYKSEPTQPRTLLGVCLALECGVLLGEVFALANLRAYVLTEGTTANGVFAGLAHVADYAAGIVLLLFLRRVSVSWGAASSERPKGGLLFPAVLAVATLLQLMLLWPPLAGLIGGHVKGSGMAMLVVLLVFGVLPSWGRVLWLFLFAKQVAACAKAAGGAAGKR